MVPTRPQQKYKSPSPLSSHPDYTTPRIIFGCQTVTVAEKNSHQLTQTMGYRRRERNHSQKHRFSLHKLVVKETHEDLQAFVHASLVAWVDDEQEAVDLGIVVVPDSTDVFPTAEIIQRHVISVERKANTGETDRRRWKISCNSWEMHRNYHSCRTILTVRLNSIIP